MDEKQQILNWELINERICVIRIKGKFHNISLIKCAYALTEEKTKEEKEIGLEINGEKTKALISTTSRTRARRIGQNLTLGDYNFEVINAFTYLGISIDNENNVNKEIKRRIISASKCA